VINKVAYFISKGGIGNWNDLDMLREFRQGLKSRLTDILKQRLAKGVCLMKVCPPIFWTQLIATISSTFEDQIPSRTDQCQN